MRHDSTNSRPAPQSGSFLLLLGLMDRFDRLMQDRDNAAHQSVAGLDSIIKFLELKDSDSALAALKAVRKRCVSADGAVEEFCESHRHDLISLTTDDGSMVLPTRLQRARRSCQ